MASQNLDNLYSRPVKSKNFVLPALVLWGVAFMALFAFIWLEDGFAGTFKEYYLLPWSLLAGIVVLSPTIYLVYCGKFDPFHPLVYAAWSYVFPAFVIGGVIVSFNLVDPYFLVFIDDPQYNLPLSLVYISVGFIGLILGYYLPVGSYIAKKVEKRLPKWEWQPDRVWVAGIILLIAGLGINILGFLQGFMGFQRLIEFGTFDATLNFLLIFVSAGTILLWLAIFSTKNKTGAYYIVLTILILLLPIRMALLGSRGSLMVSIIAIAMAFRYSGRKLRWQTSIAFAGFVLAAVFVGIVYGTAFRNIKGSESRVDAGDYAGQIAATVEYISNEDPLILIQNSSQSLANRIENLSSVAVVVANYERLAPYEASYGLENNIVNDTLTSFIPRFLWNDKPPTSDARAYSSLYFNYGDNSFAISPFADLLRNFGSIGVPLGMLVLGVYLRLIYSLLIETATPSMWKKVAYFPLLTLVSYEAFYATIFPSVIRTVVILVISVLIVNFIARTKVKS